MRNSKIRRANKIFTNIARGYCVIEHTETWKYEEAYLESCQTTKTKFLQK